MKIPSDKMMHLKGGFVLAFALAVFMEIALWNPPAAICLGGAAACAGVEWYQWLRGNGRPEWLDFWYGVIPSIGMALTAYILHWWGP
jgi:hypothetical protein